MRVAARILPVLLSAACVYSADAAPRTICFFQDDTQRVVQVNSIDDIPAAYRSRAKCLSEKPRKAAAQDDDRPMAAPEEVTLGGTVRRDNIASPLGRIELRWQRKIETLFGRTPQRAMVEAAAAASRALKHGGFPPHVQNLDLNWRVVFMDEQVPETQIPSYLVSNCHPAWMTPIANLYVVAQRVAAGCGGRAAQSSVADSELTHILIHEIGHAIEFQLLRGAMGSDRARAEGFASWFEMYASEFSSVVPSGSVRRLYYSAAARAFAGGATIESFDGGFEGYAIASTPFAAVVARRGVRGIAEIYDAMAQKQLDLAGAIDARLGWNRDRLLEEAKRVVK